MNRSDQERLWRMAITKIQQGQNDAVRIENVDPFELEAVLAKIDSAILDLESLRDQWNKESE